MNEFFQKLCNHVFGDDGFPAAATVNSSRVVPPKPWPRCSPSSGPATVNSDSTEIKYDFGDSARQMPENPEVVLAAAKTAQERTAKAASLRNQLKVVRQRKNQAAVNAGVARQYAEKSRRDAEKKQPGWLTHVRHAKRYDEIAANFEESVSIYQAVEKNLLTRLAELA